MKYIQTILVVLVLSVFGTMSYGQIKVVAPNGDVGIGTSTPSEKLEVNGGILPGSATNNTNGTIRYTGSDLEGRIGGSWMSLTQQGGGGGGGSVWSTGAGGDVYYTGGDVGIGLTNPLRDLDVDGDARFRGNTLDIGWGLSTNAAVTLNVGGGRTVDGASFIDVVSDQSDYPNAGFRFGRTGTGLTTLQHWGDRDFTFRAETELAAISFVTNDGATTAKRMIIKDTGNVGVGTTNPTSLLHVNGDIFYSGSLISSDKRLKKDIELYEDGLEKLMQIQPYTYYYNGKADIKSEKLQYGVLAQDMQAIDEEFVGEFTHEVTEFNKDTGYDEVIRTEDYLYINSNAITYLLVNSIKEQQAMIDEKNDVIDDLSDRLSKLEEQIESLASGGEVNSSVTLSYHDIAELNQNTPNPFNGSTTIAYTVPTEAKTAKINIYNNSGVLIKSIDINHTGKGALTVNANDIPSGNYAYQLVIDNKVTIVNTMILQN